MLDGFVTQAIVSTVEIGVRARSNSDMRSAMFDCEIFDKKKVVSIK